MPIRTMLIALTVTGLTAAYPAPASAQTVTSEVFKTVVPFTYDRGRNVSVEDRPRQTWEPAGIDIGGFTAFPSINVSTGFTSNVYQGDAALRRADAIFALAPSLSLRSNWSTNALKLDASGNFVRYVRTPSRFENGYSVGATGKVDAGGDRTLTLGARTSQVYENQFTSVGTPVVHSARPVQASLFNVLGDFRFVRVRAVLAGDYSDFAYRSVQTFASTTLSQTNRNRDIARGVAHLEYGLTPDAGGFIQVAYSDTSYRHDFAPGVANRDSSELRVLAGISVDLTSSVRGSLGVGYIDRDYRAALYRDLSGISLDGKVEYFPSQLTTVTLSGRRDIEDAAIASASGYFNTGIGLRVDHELLRNLILYAGADYENDSYRGVIAKSDILRFSSGGRYLVSPMYQINGVISYNERDSNSAFIGPPVNELRFTLGLAVRH